MKLREALQIVEGIVVSDRANLDLMSDALRFGREDVLLITGLTNPQAVRTAEMVGIRAVLFVRAKLPPPETVIIAREAGIVLMATRYTMYEASGLLFRAGLPGLGACGEFG